MGYQTGSQQRRLLLFELFGLDSKLLYNGMMRCRRMLPGSEKRDPKSIPVGVSPERFAVSCQVDCVHHLISMFLQAHYNLLS